MSTASAIQREIQERATAQKLNELGSVDWHLVLNGNVRNGIKSMKWSISLSVCCRIVLIGRENIRQQSRRGDAR